LDTFLEREWQEWAVAREDLIADGYGTGEKEEQIYCQAALRATAPPPPLLMEILGRARHMAKES
jgi:hypothetical protein